MRLKFCLVVWKTSVFVSRSKIPVALLPERRLESNPWRLKRFGLILLPLDHGLIEKELCLWSGYIKPAPRFTNAGQLRSPHFSSLSLSLCLCLLLPWLVVPTQLTAASIILFSCLLSVRVNKRFVWSHVSSTLGRLLVSSGIYLASALEYSLPWSLHP